MGHSSASIFVNVYDGELTNEQGTKVLNSPCKDVKLQERFRLSKTTYRLVGHIKGTSWNFSEKC